MEEEVLYFSWWKALMKNTSAIFFYILRDYYFDHILLYIVNMIILAYELETKFIVKVE